jgi:Uma2 family endonuclease
VLKNLQAGTEGFWAFALFLRDTNPMASSTLIPVSEYLSTTYRPDCDYIDGEVRDRNLGEQPHAHLQAIFAGIFREYRKLWGVRALTEQRVQVSARRYRIADVCILRSTDPQDPIIRVAPLLCIEILSKGDSLSELQERVDDYAGMGVQSIWAIDPWKRHGYVATTRGFDQPQDGIFSVPETPIRISLGEVFAELDESVQGKSDLQR